MRRAIRAIVLLVSTPVLPSIIGGHGPGRTPMGPGLAQGAVPGFSGTLGGLTITSSDPDGAPTITGSPVTVTFWILLGAATRNWRLLINANSSSLVGCTRVPASAIRVSCRSASGNGVTCGGTYSLSTTPLEIASGNEPPLWGTVTVTLAYSFVDGWRYPASAGQSCSLGLTYTVDAP